MFGADLLDRQPAEAGLEVGPVMLALELERSLTPLAGSDEGLEELQEVVRDVGKRRLRGGHGSGVGGHP